MQQLPRRRVAVTGLGILSPVGNSISEAWQAIANGQSGVATIDFEAPDLTTQIAARVPKFDSSLSLSNKEMRRTDLFVQYGVEAARQAMEDAGLEITDELAPRAGVAVGSGIGGLPGIETACMALNTGGGPRKISPFFIPGSIINMVAGLISMKHHLMGPNLSIVTACTTGAHNIGHAARMIIHGDADVMVAGGAEMSTCSLGIGGFNAIKALSTRNDAPEKASRPWDKDRDGFVLGEGAGILILEEMDFAKKRGAHIYAELAGFGMSGDAYHMTAPCADGAGFILAMENSLRDAQLAVDTVDYVNAHATSTMADLIEAFAIKKTFGAHAAELAVSSTKSMTGHLLGAAGAVEAILSVLAIKHQVAPPTINLDNPDEGCDLNFVPHTAQSRKIDVALSNSFGFGGTNASLVFRKV